MRHIRTRYRTSPSRCPRWSGKRPRLHRDRSPYREHVLHETSHSARGQGCCLDRSPCCNVLVATSLEQRDRHKTHLMPNGLFMISDRSCQSRSTATIGNLIERHVEPSANDFGKARLRKRPRCRHGGGCNGAGGHRSVRIGTIFQPTSDCDLDRRFHGRSARSPSRIFGLGRGMWRFASITDPCGRSLLASTPGHDRISRRDVYTHAPGRAPSDGTPLSPGRPDRVARGHRASPTEPFKDGGITGIQAPRSRRRARATGC